MTEYDITEAFKRIENELIDSMIRNLKKHRVEEIEEGRDWEMWQGQQIREMERYRQRNLSKFTSDFMDINDKTRELYDRAFREGADTPTKAGLSKLLGKNYKGSYGINEGKMNSLIEATQSDLEKAEQAVLRKANDEYRKIIFDAQVYAQSGGTYEQAVDMATKDFLKNGINSVVYKNGARHTIPDYASMAIRTGQKRAYLMGLGNQMNKMGVHTVRVNKRTGACPFCAVWVGRVLVDDVYSGGTVEESVMKNHPLLSFAMEKGFLHPNCKDVYSLYVEGISKPEKPPTRAEVDHMVAVYNAEQKLKHAKDKLASYRRLMRNSLDPQNKEKYRLLKEKWEEKVEKYQRIYDELTKKEVSPEALDVVPLINHSGMREAIEVERELTLKGLFEFPEGAITFGESWENEYGKEGDRWHRFETSTFVTLNKQISIPWEDFGRRGQSHLKWNLPSYRIEKPFLIQKKDFQNRAMTITRYENGQKNESEKWYIRNGYEYRGQIAIKKYNQYFMLDVGEKDNKFFFIMDGTVEEEGVVSKNTIDKILAREKIVSKRLWDNGVTFKQLRTRGDRYNQEIEDAFNHGMEVFHTAVEADGPVSLVTKEAYDKVKGEEMYRGIARNSSLRLGTAPPPRKCATQLMEGGVGDCFPSRGIYGDGVGYWSNSTQIGNNYSSRSEGIIVRAKIKDDAKIIMYDDAVRLFEEVYNAHPNDKSIYFSKDQRGSGMNLEVGKAMQILGYDAIIKPNGDHSGATFFIILNRSALVGVAGDYIWKVIG